MDDDGSTYRTMYTTRIGDIVYVHDAFQKKSKRGIATPQRDLDRIEQRLKLAVDGSVMDTLRGLPRATNSMSDQAKA